MKYKNLNDIETIDLSEFIEPEQSLSRKKPENHYLKQCPDISPKRFNELVLEAIAEFNAKQGNSVKVHTKQNEAQIDTKKYKKQSA